MNKLYIILSICILILFGSTYFVYQNNIDKAKVYIEQQNRLKQHQFLEAKSSFFNEFSNDYPDHTQLFNDYFDLNKARFHEDTLIQFFVYSSNLPTTDYDLNFYDCLIAKCESDIINSREKEKITYSLSQVKKKYGEKVGFWFNEIGESKFLNSIEPNEICAGFFENIKTSQQNNTAFKEFERFLQKMREDERKYERESKKTSSKYRNELVKAKNSLTSSGRRMFDREVESINLLVEESAYMSFNGDVLGKINYSFPVKRFREDQLNTILDRVYHDQYKENSLSNGAKPYAYCFGASNACGGYGCSQIIVRTPSSSDVLVTIKRNDKVYRHAYIKAGRSYTFNFPDGTYQPFFYYGKGWNPNKFMKNTSCGKLKGGFISNELFGKDYPQQLYGQILSYELILQQNGNFSTKPSNRNEAF